MIIYYSFEVLHAFLYKNRRKRVANFAKYMCKKFVLCVFELIPLSNPKNNT